MKRLLMISMILFSLTGCAGSDDHHNCTQNVSGCDSDKYSCPASSKCYETHDACRASGDCKV